MELLIEQGRFADAEALVNRMLIYPQIDSILLGPIYCHQGRVEEAERLVEGRWHHLDDAGEGASEKAINLLRLHIELRRTIPSIDATREFLKQSGTLAPDDDRIWLGRANLAIRSGAYDEAWGLLDACLRQRPDDTALWRARLSWAMAMARVAEAREALRHLPAAQSTAADVQKLAAWFALNRGDIASERRALERLIAVDPAYFQALDRLIDLAVKEGRHDEAADLRNKKAAIEKLQSRYEELYRRNQPLRDAAEMARLAGQLGRRFESEAFLTIAIVANPERTDLRSEIARVKHQSQAANPMQGTLDAFISAEFGSGPSLGN